MPNAFNQFAEGYGQGQDMAQGFARQRAGNAMAGGDYAGGANALFKSGQIEDGAKLQAIGDDRHTEEVKHRAEFFMKAADVLSQIPDDGTQQHRRAALQRLTPTFQAMGIDPQHIQAFMSAPLDDQSLRAFKGTIAKQFQMANLGDGGVGAFDPEHGTLNVIREPLSKPLEMDPAKNYYMRDTSAAAAPDTQAQSSTPPDTDATWKAMIQRESGGDGNAVSPKGALGSTQMLPATAESMARKLSVPWRPDLMRGNTPAALAYQEKLGRAYYDEGLQKYGNDPSKAAMYYHGGPDERQWGPKTRAYAAAVAPNALQGGAGADELGKIPGYRMIQKGQAPQDDAPLEASTVDLLAGKYLNNGTLPPMGAGKTGTRNRAMILNRATTMAKGLGLDANDLVAGNMSVKAAGAALSKATTLRSQVEGSEQTVLRNADFALSLAPKGAGHTGVPVLNRWIQLGRKNVGGDPDVAAFDAALGTVADEYAKVMTTSSGTGGGATSDSARNEAKHRINAAMTPAQLKSVIGAMKVEMHNRVTSMTEVEAGLRTNIRNGGQPGGGQPQAAAAAPAQAAPAPTAPRPGEVRRGFRFKGGDPADQKNWAKVG